MEKQNNFSEMIWMLPVKWIDFDEFLLVKFDEVDKFWDTEKILRGFIMEFSTNVDSTL